MKKEPMTEDDSFMDLPLPEVELMAIKRHLSTLKWLAETGDFGAIEAIAETGNHAANVLHFIFACCHPLQRIHQAASMVAEHSERWPVSLPAVEEIRGAAVAEALPENLGKSLGINPRPRGRKRRDLVHAGQTRLAFDVHCSLELRRTKKGFPFGEKWEPMAETLAPFSADNIDQWTQAGSSLLRADFKRKGNHLVRIPDNFLAAVLKRQTKEMVSMESAFSTVAKQWLKAGFQQLAGQA